MTEIPGGDPPICDSCNEPIVGPVIRVGVERFCKPCKEKTVMPWPKPTIEDFRLKTEGTDLCWIEGCDESQRQRGLCKKHYDRARHNGLLTEVMAQIDARCAPKGEILATMPLAPGDRAVLEAHVDHAIPGAYREVLQVWAGGLRVELAEMPTSVREARAWAAAVWDKEEQDWIEQARSERSDLLGSVRRLADELTAVDQALGPYLRQVAGDRCAAIRFVSCRAEVLTAVDEALGSRLEAVGGNRLLAIEALTAPSGPVLLSEEGLRERFSRLNEIGHAESLLVGLSEPLQGALRAVLEAEKARVLRVCP